MHFNSALRLLNVSCKQQFYRLQYVKMCEVQPVVKFCHQMDKEMINAALQSAAAEEHTPH